ncbi:hypothetical protein C1646_752315 [Rhizophagus diaphanus]|nr:hypothetical protein C1646_752315 [Rhizophagus diaphanus] [Rhizophagus sp. MUCL 43196]
MRKGDFSLEILVDNEVLPEYEVSLSEKAKLTRSREKQTITYIEAPYYSCHFCIRVGVHSTLGSMVYKGVHYVDGQNDDTYMELNPLSDDPYTYIYGFYNYDKTVFHKFKFDTNCWTDDEIFVSNLPKKCTKSSKDSGVISVYVFTAERLHGKRFMSQIRNNQEMIPESPDLDNIDPRDVICLEKPQDEPIPNLRATSNKPIVELHIRYQTKEWLQNEGFDLIESPDNSRRSIIKSILFEDEQSHESDDEIVTSEHREEIIDYSKREVYVRIEEKYSPNISVNNGDKVESIRNFENDGSDDYRKEEIFVRIEEEYSPLITSYKNDEEMENFRNFENEEEEVFESERFQEKDKVESESPNYEVIRENLNKQVKSNPLNEEVAERRNFEIESKMIELITDGSIINYRGDVELADNEKLNERIREISINDKEEGNETSIVNKVEGEENLIDINRNELDSEFIDLTESPPNEVIEISDDNNDDEVILVETVRNVIPITFNRKKHRSKKIRYYSDSSIDWNHDDSSNYSDSSSEDEFISISKKRLRT